MNNTVFASVCFSKSSVETFHLVGLTYQAQILHFSNLFCLLRAIKILSKYFQLASVIDCGNVSIKEVSGSSWRRDSAIFYILKTTRA